MQLPPLTDGRILNRYKRFLADVELPGGEVVTVHCPNTGSMRGCWEPGAPVQISHSDNPRRKLAWTLERVDMGRGWVGVHTGRTNPVVEEALHAGVLAPLRGYHSIAREVPFSLIAGERSRFDFFLSQGKAVDAWVEVKNVTLLLNDGLSFPDAVTVRGRKHLEALAEACRQGLRGIMVYALNRPEGDCFRPADEIDRAYGETLRRVVHESGVEFVAVRIEHRESSMRVVGEVPVVLD
ncbi:MAG: DNA/RNA nuclease SfsA [Candidatus Thiodiazotropha sp. (ex Dulcina madagascariensis)]|nr:DNA/RNA nuclease SfsA [Candidatus Thiodiazotropha sp. (ex Dulcina madagascariensis)]MCU7927714.1 DNA/RNA nuclease SfsA [Candidatus Thiodiazotropha sp. (ex Dulcina madagascariensis)]